MIVERIIIHHSFTADSDTLSWGVMHSNHEAGYPGADHQYHAGGELVRGRVECLYGRPDNIPGAHCYGQNRKSLGFCFVGNFDEIAPDDTLLTAACRRVIVPWLRQYKLTPDDIRPHSEFSTKTCPGKMFDMDRLREIAAEIMEAAV